MNAIKTIDKAGRTMSQTAGAVGVAARDTLFAGLGIVAVAQEELARLFDSFVAEGRKVESGRSNTATADLYRDARAEVRVARAEAEESAEQALEVADETKKLTVASAATLEERVSKVIVDVLQRMNVPTREDVDALKRSVDRLDRKTSELRAV